MIRCAGLSRQVIPTTKHPIKLGAIDARRLCHHHRIAASFASTGYIDFNWFQCASEKGVQPCACVMRSNSDRVIVA